MLVDVFSKGMLGSEAEKALGEAGITVNKNAIPFDTNPPMKPSGIRLGSPALTTRGMKEGEFRQIGRWIADALDHRADAAQLARIRRQVHELADHFPLYAERRARSAVTGRRQLTNDPRRAADPGCPAIRPAISPTLLSVIYHSSDTRYLQTSEAQTCLAFAHLFRSY